MSARATLLLVNRFELNPQLAATDSQGRSNTYLLSYYYSNAITPLGPVALFELAEASIRICQNRRSHIIPLRNPAIVVKHSVTQKPMPYLSEPATERLVTSWPEGKKLETISVKGILRDHPLFSEGALVSIRCAAVRLEDGRRFDVGTLRQLGTTSLAQGPSGLG